MIETKPDAGLRQAKLTALRGRRPPQIVRREGRDPEQFADARRARIPLPLLRSATALST